MVVFGGARLVDHLGGRDAPRRIAAQGWDVVVLQEQSVLPALAGQREATMYPAVRGLAGMAREVGARPLLLLTWGRRDGLADAGLSDFAAMQGQLTRGTLGIADELGLAVAPAGEAWRAAVAERPGLALWQADGSHPSLLGSYLSACVLYAAVFGERPDGLPAPRGVAADDAALLQRVAGDVALGDVERWRLAR